MVTRALETDLPKHMFLQKLLKLKTSSLASTKHLILHVCTCMSMYDLLLLVTVVTTLVHTGTKACYYLYIYIYIFTYINK